MQLSSYCYKVKNNISWNVLSLVNVNYMSSCVFLERKINSYSIFIHAVANIFDFFLLVFY